LNEIELDVYNKETLKLNKVNNENPYHYLGIEESDQLNLLDQLIKTRIYNRAGKQYYKYYMGQIHKTQLMNRLFPKSKVFKFCEAAQFNIQVLRRIQRRIKDKMSVELALKLENISMEKDWEQAIKFVLE